MAWGALLGLLAVLAGLFGLCILLVRRAGVAPACAPLAALALAALALLAGGLAGALRPAALTVLAVGLAGGAAEILLAARQGQPGAAAAALQSPAARLFWALAALLAVWLAYLQPVFLNFDEYSSWGTAARLTTLYDQLYTLCDTGLPWQMSELPALPLMSYFFQLFGAFAPWRAIFAADVLMLAACAAVGGCARQARLALPVMLAALLTPLLLSSAGHTALLTTAWLEFLGDLPAGMLFGGAAAYWLASRRRGAAARWLCLPVVLLAANIKTNTLVLALAAAGLVALDAGLFPPAQAPRGPRAAAARWGFGLACLAAPLAQYALWGSHIAPLVQQNAAAGGMGDTAAATLPQVVANGLRLLLGLPVDGYFAQRQALFWQYGRALADAFWQRDVAMFGPGAAVAAVALLLFAAALALAPGRRAKLRAAVLAAGSTACFAGYWLMLWLSYAFLLKDSTPDTLASYARYFASYYAGWLLLALAVLGGSCQASRRPLAGRAAALAAGGAFAAVFALQSEAQFTLFGVGQGAYAPVRQELAVAEQAAAVIAPQERVFLIRQGDTGFYWFLYHQALAPLQLVYGAGGATYGAPDPARDDPYYAAYTAEEFSAMIAEEEVDWLLVRSVDAGFVQSYGALFTDGLAAAQAGPTLYRVTAEGYTPAAALAGEEAGA